MSGGILHNIPKAEVTMIDGPKLTTLEAVCDQLHVGLHLGDDAVVETSKTNIPHVNDTIMGGAQIVPSRGVRGRVSGHSYRRGVFDGTNKSIHGESKSGGGPAPRPELGTTAKPYGSTSAGRHKRARCANIPTRAVTALDGVSASTIVGWTYDQGTLTNVPGCGCVRCNKPKLHISG